MKAHAAELDRMLGPAPQLRTLLSDRRTAGRPRRFTSFRLSLAVAAVAAATAATASESRNDVNLLGRPAVRRSDSRVRSWGAGPSIRSSSAACAFIWSRRVRSKSYVLTGRAPPVAY